jgi:CheY-like chemotaxis protein
MKPQAILIVEDNLKNPKLTRAILEMGNYQVLRCGTDSC